jgi:hypothetical protein
MEIPSRSEIDTNYSLQYFTMDVDFTGSGSGNGSSAVPLDIDLTGSLPGAAPPLIAPAHLLGLVVPGRPVRTDFVPADASGTKYALTLRAPGDLPHPLTTVSEVVCFLLPNAPLPPQQGILLYWQLSSPGREATGFELLGSITHERPSAIFRTRWSHNQILLEQHQNSPKVTLGISIEPLENIQNVDSGSANEKRLFVAQQIATDLFQFMQSFDTGAVGGMMMTVPTNIFDRWMQRFEARFRRDPNFFMKTE